MTLAVIILTHNEARHIERALASVSSIATEVFVIDSGSTDGTIDLAIARGAHVLTHAWINYADQFQWALDNAPITADWVMRLDADEIIEPDLATEIARRLGSLPSEVSGVNLKRKHIFMGRWIRHGGRYPLVLLRIWRRGAARIEQRWMDEHMLLTEGQDVTFEGGFSDHNLNDLTFFTDKHNKYATREAVDVLNQRLSLFSNDKGLSSERSSQAAIKRNFKEKLYNNFPFGLGPTLYFLYRYFWQAGILDGKEGAIYHVLQGFWYRYLVDAKVLELKRAIDHESDLSNKLSTLEKLTGLKLSKSTGQ